MTPDDLVPVKFPGDVVPITVRLSGVVRLLMLPGYVMPVMKLTGDVKPMTIMLGESVW